MSFSINKSAVRIVEEEIIPNLDSLQVELFRLKNGTVVIDMGIKAKGGWVAGKLYTETCLGGLGEMTLETMRIGKYLIPMVAIHVDRPEIAEICSHDALIHVPYKGKTAVLSGPLRSINPNDPYGASVKYRDKGAQKAVCHMQTDEIPTEELSEALADSVGISPKDIYLLVARTGSMTGAVQVCARNIEQTMPSIFDHGFDVNKVMQASGYSPITTFADDEYVSYGRVNDCLIYGQETNLYVDCEDEEITAILDKLPFTKNKDIYGTPFEIIFDWCGREWAKVPREWDAPCKVNFINMRTGNRFTAGMLSPETLVKSFLG